MKKKISENYFWIRRNQHMDHVDEITKDDRDHMKLRRCCGFHQVCKWALRRKFERMVQNSK